jgi:hypothetical protein
VDPHADKPTDRISEDVAHTHKPADTMHEEFEEEKTNPTERKER